MTYESTVPEELGDPALRAASALPEPGAVTIVVPTRDESASIRELLHRITESVPSRLPCEVVFVDDSTDDTPEVIREAARDCPYPVTVLHRDTPAGGPGGAVVEGMRAATSDWIVVMAAGLRHPPCLVPELVAAGERTHAGLVVASRYSRGGSRTGLGSEAASVASRYSRGGSRAGPGPEAAPAGRGLARALGPPLRRTTPPPAQTQAGGRRVAASRGAAWLAKALFPRRLRGISDPMSGFFAIRRSAVTADVLKPLGHRILLETAVRARPRQVTEVPYVLREGFVDESGPTAREGVRFLRYLAGLRTASPVARMVVFGLIGATGFLPNLAALWALTAAGVHYLPAEIAANQFGVAWNFLLLEHLCFRDRRLHRRWWDRAGRFALLANADLVLRIPLIALFVGQFGMSVLGATALALVTTFVLRFVGTEALVYMPRKGGRAGSTTAVEIRRHVGSRTARRTS